MNPLAVMLAALATLLMVGMAAAAPRAFVLVLVLGMLLAGALYISTPKVQYEDQPPPRVMPP